MFLQQLINGITIGSIYALVTVGFSMVWSILQLANFAHGSFYMLAPYLALTAIGLFGASPAAFLCVVLIVALFTACLGAGMDRALLRPIREKKVSTISTILCTIGVQTVINNGIIAVYGTQSRAFPDPFQLPSINVGNAVISWMQILIFVLAVSLMLIPSKIVYGTKLGGPCGRFLKTAALQALWASM